MRPGKVAALLVVSTFLLAAVFTAPTPVPSGGNIPNYAINGGVRLVQRGATFTAATTPTNADDTYLFDRWILLSDGNDIVDVSQETTVVPTGAYASAKLDIETQDKKWGLLQLFEARDSTYLAGRTISISFEHRIGSADTSTLLRAAIVEWSSTADSVTSDLVSAWGAEGTNPTLIANWAYANTPVAIAAGTTAFVKVDLEWISVDSGANNVGVFIWSDDMTNAVGDLVYIGNINVVAQATVGDFTPRPIEREQSLAARYFERLNFSSADTVCMVALQTGSQAEGVIHFRPKRIQPTMSVSAVTDFDVITANSLIAGTGFIFVQGNTAPFDRSGVTVTIAGATGGDAGYVRADGDHRYIDVDAEL